MERGRCAVCGKPIREAAAWKRCGRYGWAEICTKHCLDTCGTIFGDHCANSSTHAPTARSSPVRDYSKKRAAEISSQHK